MWTRGINKPNPTNFRGHSLDSTLHLLDLGCIFPASSIEIESEYRDQETQRENYLPLLLSSEIPPLLRRSLLGEKKIHLQVHHPTGNILPSPLGSLCHLFFSTPSKDNFPRGRQNPDALHTHRLESEVTPAGTNPVYLGLTYNQAQMPRASLGLLSALPTSSPLYAHALSNNGSRSANGNVNSIGQFFAQLVKLS